MKHPLPLLAILASMPAATATAETRQLDAHEHGVAVLNIAIEAQTVAMALVAPGADIVGFEYTAESDEDRATVESAMETLSAPLDLFALPEAASCTVVEARATLTGAGGYHDHGDHEDAHQDEHGDEHKHDDHDDEHHDEHKHDDHDDEHHDAHKHDDHDDEHHDEHKHDEHKHDDHEDEHHDDHAEHDAHGDDHAEENHNEFHADYVLACSNPNALSGITFTYFDRFPNAQEVEVQVISASGAMAFEVLRDSPALTLEP